jgi:colanic acid/amylovoran/stewartan biosynthesis glycosyltransferase WcaL/AmsK/CpsK
VIALERTDQFVGRTMNWLYDHLRVLPRYTPLVLCDTLANRREFPELEARTIDDDSLGRRIWRRLAGRRLYPPDRNWLKRVAPRVLHSHFGYVASRDLHLAQALGVPWIVSFYGADLYELGRQEEWRRRYAAVFSRATKVLALGPVMGSSLERLGCPSHKLAIHPLGVDVDQLHYQRRLLRLGEPLRLLFAGTFREKKGLQYVVEGVAQARKMGVQLELQLVGGAQGKTGDRETADAVSRLINERGIEDVVRRSGFLEFDQLMELALCSHVFVGPSVTAADGDAEGTPFVLQQMMATGMPCIATEHSDIPYLFGDARTMLVPERDGAAIADRIQRYWKAPAMLAADGDRLRQQIRARFDVRLCAERLAQLYDRLLC